MNQETYRGPVDTMGRPRMLKSFAEIVQEVKGADWNLDEYTQNLAREFSKALYTTTANTAAAGPYGGSGGGLSAIELQNLDATMTAVLFQKKNLVMFNWLTKVPSLTPYYEWNRMNRYGSSRANRGFVEGGAPQGGTVMYTRNGQYIRYLGVKRGISHQMMLSGQLGGTQLDPVEAENRAGTLELLENIERGLLFSDGNIGDQTSSQVNYDGFLPWLNKNAPQQIIDMKGQPFTFETIENLGFNYFQSGKLTDLSQIRLFMNGQVLADLSKLRFQADRHAMTGSQVGGFNTGLPLVGHDSNFGHLGFEKSIFMEDVDGGTPLNLTQQAVADSGAPAALTAANITFAVTSPDATSNIPAGTYYYSVAAVNDSGESLATIAGNGGGSPAPVVIPAAGGSVLLACTAGVDASTTNYRVYRGSLANGSDAQWIGRIPAGSATGVIYSGTAVGTQGGAFKFKDTNWWNPTAKGLVVAFDRSPENVAIAQMTPLLRWPLPIVNTQLQWLLLLYHALVIKAQERCYVYKNVGLLQ